MEAKTVEEISGWMSIEELAAASKMTVRNIRAHQSRGMLPKPFLRGRKGYYDASHLERLKQIAAMQDRGYSLAAIHDLLEHLDPENVHLGVLEALNGWEGDAPLEMNRHEFTEKFGFLVDNRDLLEKATQAGLIAINGDKVVIPLPALAEVALSLVQHNADGALLPFLNLTMRTQTNLRVVARDVVGTFTRDVLLKTDSGGTALSIGRIVSTFRPLGLAAISALFSQAIENEIKALLTSRGVVEN